MRHQDDAVQPYVTTVTVDGRRLDVTVLIAYDGIEYVGRLQFAEADWDDAGIIDRGLLPARTKDEVEAMAKRLTERELVARYRRGTANKRRYIALREVTDDFLRQVRYLNQVAISMRAGLIDLDGAAQEIDVTEHQLHELVQRMRDVAGIDELEA